MWAMLLVLTLGIFALAAAPCEAESPYRTAGLCGGYPRVDLQSIPGTCVGLVASGLGFARGVAVLGQDVFVADMGGWGSGRGRGRLVRLKDFGRSAPEVLLTGLDEPNGLEVGPDGRLYIGFGGRIARINLSGDQTTLTDVVTGLPTTGRHPLTAFIIAPDGSFYINIGSGTNNCEQKRGARPDPARPCPETEAAPPRGVIVHVIPMLGHTVSGTTATVFATGLRNSMALAFLPDGRLAAAVNARDYINLADPRLSDNSLPHDTLDVIRSGADYGWPYCFDNDRPSPEYPNFDCKRMQLPDFLLPPHAAPLGMIVYRGTALPGLSGMLLINYHGYRASGHRLVAMPILPSGGLAGTTRDVIWGWQFRTGASPLGSPVGLAELPDGSMLITEDRNGTLLRLARS
jgi:glucose/arabinose dehydrogenase